MEKFRLSVFLLAFFISSHARCQSEQPVGCGTGWNYYLVPDRISFLSCNFKPACENHDVCYSKCQTDENNALCNYKKCWRGGEFNGKKVCNSPAYVPLMKQAVDRKNICDARFYDQLISDNRNGHMCKEFARLYRFAVSKLGDEAFSGLGTSAGLSERQKAENNQALVKLLTEWPEKNKSVYIKKVEAGEIVIDWGKPLVFDPGRGLIPK